MSTALNDIIGPDAVVKRIVERMSNATLLEDKKTALNELREKAAEHPEPVARLAQALLLEWMPAAKEDLETLRGILGTLQECLASEREEAFREANSRNAVSFAKEPNNISILLENLEINDWAVRLAVLKMLAAMERFCPAALSSAILASAQGPARLMDVLSDQREIIRNEVLLVLSGLTGGGKELELNKILAFEGAFDVLFGIVASDEEGPESVIVRDCLTIALNLLHNNPSNVSYFREMGCVGNHVVPLLRKAGGVDGSGMGASQTLWGAVCSLLAGLITWADDSQKMQTNMGKQGVIEIVMAAVAGGGLSVESKGHGLRLVGSLVHVHTPNRLLLSSIMLQGGSTALGAVLRMCLEELEIGQDPQHSLNAAAAFLFQCYLHQNVDGQQHLAATLMPQPSMDDEEEGGMEEPVGRQVMKAVLLIDKADDRAISAGNPDALAALTKVWGAATVLGLILHNNSVCQEIAVASPLELPSAGAPEMFLPSLLAALSKGSAAQGGGIDGRGECFLLQLFAIWLHKCPSAAHAMSSEPSHVMWLVGLLGSTPGRERMPERVALQVRGCASLVLASCLQFAEDSELLSSIIGIIESRVGLQVFQQHITLMLKSEPFLAAKRRTEGGSAMGAGGGGGGKGAPEHAAWAFPVFSPEFASVAAQVAEGLQKKMLKIMGGPGSPVRGVDESVVRERDALRDQLKELQAQLEEAGGGKGGEEERDQALRRCEEVEEVLREREMEARALREAKEEADKELKALMHSNRALEEEVERKSAEVDDLQLKLANGGGEGGDQGGDDSASLISDLQRSVKEQQERAKKEAEAHDAALKEVEAKLAAAQDEIQRLSRENAGGGGETEQLTAQIQDLTAKLGEAEAGRAAAEKELAERNEAFKSLEEEHNDLLIMLADEDGGGEEGSPIQIAGWDVLDRSAWWEDVKFWFEDDPGSWTESAFFMVLRRIGFRALNDAGPPASLGHDFALKRTDVLRHGYVFKVDVLERYNKLLHRKLGLPSTKIVTPDAEASASAQADKARCEGNLKAQLRAQESQWHQRASSDKPEEEGHEDGDPDATDTQPAPDTPPAPPLLPCSSSSSASSSLCGSQPGTPSLCQ